MTYYYAVASLPALSLGAPPPLAMEDFLAEMARVLRPGDTASLRALLEGDRAIATDAFATRWFNAETQLRNAIAHTRAARRSIDATPHLHAYAGFSNYIEMAVVDAYAKPNPLERELTLDRFRWSLLDEYARPTPFGFEAVQAYALKLRIVRRWAALTDETGREQLRAAVQGVREKAAAREAAPMAAAAGP